MKSPRSNPNGGFTLVELIIGLSLSLMVMGAVLSSYVFLGRNFTRSLGISLSNQPTLEAQGRRTLAYFTQDVRMASGLDTSGSSPKVSPSATGMTLILPSSSGTKYITYYYNSTASAATLSSFTIPANSLVRIDLGKGIEAACHPPRQITNILPIRLRLRLAHHTTNKQHNRKRAAMKFSTKV